MARSVARAMIPPSASTSRTTVPFATPPMAGLHDIWPIVSSALVISPTRAPETRRGDGRLGAGVAGADDDDVELGFKVSRLRHTLKISAAGEHPPS